MWVGGLRRLVQIPNLDLISFEGSPYRIHPPYQAWSNSWQNQPEEKEDDLDATDDGESSEKSHGASNKTQLGLHLDLLVLLNVVKGGRVKVDLHQLEGWLWQFLSWGDGNSGLKLKV